MTPFIELADLKAHLNITIADDDALLTNKIAAASEYIAAWIDPAVVASWSDPTIPGAAVPDPIQEATRKLAGDFYENRQSAGNEPSIETEFNVFYLIMPYRAWSF